MEFNILLMKHYILTLLFCATQLNAQPVLVKDIYPGNASSNPYGLVDFNGNLVFNASDDIHGSETWIANGANAYMIPEINLTGSSVGALGLNRPCLLNNVLYYPANDGITGTELYKWDGINNPEKVVDLNTTSIFDGSIPTCLSAVDGKLYFCAYTDNQRFDFMVYDPLTNLTERVKDIDPSFVIPDNLLQLSYMSAIDNSLYFSTYYQNGDSNMQVFKYIPSTKNLTRTGEIGANNGAYGYKKIGSYVYFINYTRAGKELWAWDGVHQAYSISQFADMSLPEEYNGMLYFAATPHFPLLKGLFHYDPVTQKTAIVEMPKAFNGINYSTLKAYAGKLFFCSDRALWRYDGINKPEMITKDDITYTGYEMCVSGNILYMTGGELAVGEELYAYYEAPTSVNTVTQQTPISIYPNPTTSSWNFDLSSFNQNNLQLIITDVTGRVVSKQQVNNDKKISATAPVPGTYLYYVTDDAGTAIQSGKLQKL
jgi:ELWxxDGT repeat protein